MTFGTGLAVSSNVHRIGCISSRGEALGHHMHAAATGGGAVHQHDTALDRVADCRVRPEGNLCAIASREMSAFRQIGEIHVLERVINARHWRRRLAWSAKCDRESKGRHKNCNNNKDGDEKTLHAMGLTRIRWQFVIYFCLHRGKYLLKSGELANAKAVNLRQELAFRPGGVT